MPDKDDNPSQAPSHRFAYLDELHLGGIERRIAKGDYVSAEDLAAALRKHGSRPIPPCVLDYLCRLLEGQVAKPKGRKAQPASKKRHRQMIIRHLYRRYLAWLQDRKARYGDLEGWPGIRGRSWWQGPPHERAARMVAHRFSYAVGCWPSILNEVSSRK